MEIREADTETNRVNALEEGMTGVDQKLKEILTLLSAQNSKTGVPEVPKTIWSDNERLATVKVPEPKAVLVISGKLPEEASATPYLKEKANGKKFIKERPKLVPAPRRYPKRNVPKINCGEIEPPGDDHFTCKCANC